MIKTLLLCTALLFSICANGQMVDSVSIDRVVDSLLRRSGQMTDKREIQKALQLQERAENLVVENLGKESALYGRVCLSRGRTMLVSANYPEAERWYWEALSIWRKTLGPDHEACSVALDGLGILYYYTGKFADAEPLYLESLRICEKTNGKETLDYALSLNNLGNLYMTTQRYAAADSMFEISRGILEKTTGKEHFHYAMNLLNSGMTHYHREQFDKAITFYTQAAQVSAKVLGKNDIYYAWAINSLANTYRDLYNFEAAEKLYLEAKAVREKLLQKDHPELITTLTGLADLYQKIGDYETSENLYLDVKAKMESANRTNDYNYPSVLHGLAVLYDRMGNFEKTESLLRQSIAISESIRGKGYPGYDKALGALANAYLAQGKYEQCEQLYRDAMAIVETTVGRETALYAIFKINLANVHHALGELGIAEKTYLEAKTILEKSPFSQSTQAYLDCLDALVQVYTKTGEYHKGESLCNILAEKRSAILSNEHPAFGESLEHSAILNWKSGKRNEAGLILANTEQVQRKTLQRSLLHLSEREMYFHVRKYKNSFDKLNSFGLATSAASPTFAGICFDNAVFHKGLLLNTSGKIRQSLSMDTMLSEKMNLFRSYHRRLSAEYVKPIAEQNKAHLFDWHEKANAIEKELTRTVAGVAESNRQVTWQQVQSALQPHEAALEFIHFNYYKPEPTDSVLYAALLLKPGMQHPLFIPLFEEKQLKALLPAADAKINRDQVNELYGINPGDIKNTLYRLLWTPLEKHLSGVRTVYYSPSGMLHRFNLSALPVSDQTTLSDRHDLVVLGSTRQLASENKMATPGATPTALLLGGIQFNMDSTAYPVQTAGHTGGERGLSFYQTDSTLRGDTWNYLKGSEKEVDDVRTELSRAGVDARIIKGWQATEESFKQIGRSGPSPRILHVSTHGYFFPDPAPRPREGGAGSGSPLGVGGNEPVFKLSDHPMIRSGLILAGANHAWKTGRPLGNREDGVLTAYEISQLDLRNTELVVLSACETGLGHIEGNEGVYGLQRAFKIAGAKTLVMSLWQVSDLQTQELMTVFYQKWLLGKMPVRQALQAAQKEMRDKGYEQYYWAGFVVVE